MKTKLLKTILFMEMQIYFCHYKKRNCRIIGDSEINKSIVHCSIINEAKMWISFYQFCIRPMIFVKIYKSSCLLVGRRLLAYCTICMQILKTTLKKFTENLEKIQKNDFFYYLFCKITLNLRSKICLNLQRYICKLNEKKCTTVYLRVQKFLFPFY